MSCNFETVSWQAFLKDLQSSERPKLDSYEELVDYMRTQVGVQRLKQGRMHRTLRPLISAHLSQNPFVRYSLLGYDRKDAQAYARSIPGQQALRKWQLDVFVAEAQCATCKTQLVWKSPFKLGKSKFCNRSCWSSNPAERAQRWEKTQATCLQRFGYRVACQSPEVQERMRASCRKNLGVEHALQSASVQAKFKETCLRRFGQPNPSQNPQVAEKKRQTCQQTLGTDTPFSSRHVQQKIKQTVRRKYGVTHAGAAPTPACQRKV